MLLPLALCASLCACAGETDDVDYQRLESAVEGPWAIPADVLAVGDSQYVDYTGAGPWVGEGGCGGSFLPGTQQLEDWIGAYFPQVSGIGGYSCRPINGNPDVMSVHATGRAIDIFIPLDSGEADNDLGDPLANYLIMHAEELGIQYIIWDRWSWNASRTAGAKDKSYGGAHPHHDHLHVELSVAAANQQIPWYDGPMDPPDLPPCGVIPAEGGIIDDSEACARAFGPADYWRVVEGAGHGGRLLWTNAFESDTPSNWGRFDLHFEAAGTYELFYHSTPEYAVFDSVDYEIRHGGEVSQLSVDQGQLDGWVSLGRYDFEVGGLQSVSVFDTAATAAEDQRIVFDALRIVPVDPNEPGGPGGSGVGPDGEGGGSGSLLGGCAAGGSGGSAGGLVVLSLLALVARRRRD